MPERLQRPWQLHGRVLVRGQRQRGPLRVRVRVRWCGLRERGRQPLPRGQAVRQYIGARASRARGRRRHCVGKEEGQVRPWHPQQQDQGLGPDTGNQHYQTQGEVQQDEESPELRVGACRNTPQAPAVLRVHRVPPADQGWQAGHPGGHRQGGQGPPGGGAAEAQARGEDPYASRQVQEGGPEVTGLHRMGEVRHGREDAILQHADGGELLRRAEGRPGLPGRRVRALREEVQQGHGFDRGRRRESHVAGRAPDPEAAARARRGQRSVRHLQQQARPGRKKPLEERYRQRKKHLVVLRRKVVEAEKALLIAKVNFNEASQALAFGIDVGMSPMQMARAEYNKAKSRPRQASEK